MREDLVAEKEGRWKRGCWEREGDEERRRAEEIEAMLSIRECHGRTEQ